MIDRIHRIHRILSGSPEHRAELVAAGLVVAIWFAMDVVQFVDWAIQKYNQPPALMVPSAPCIPLPGTNSCFAPALGYDCDSHGCSIPLTQNNNVVPLGICHDR